jgi:hypothetical protein
MPDASWCSTTRRSSRPPRLAVAGLGLSFLAWLSDVSLTSTSHVVGYVRNTIGQGCLGCSSWEICSATIIFAKHMAVVDLDAVESGSGLESLFVFGEDDSRTVQATTVLAVLQEYFLGPADGYRCRQAH